MKYSQSIDPKSLIKPSKSLEYLGAAALGIVLGLIFGFGF